MGDLSDDEIQHYRYIHTLGNGIREPRWRGVRVVKFPEDLILYAQVIWKRRPDFIVETGTRFGGSALFFGDMLQLIGGKKVFTIDVSHECHPPPHPMVEHVLGSSIDPAIVERIRSEVSDGKVMVVLDSDHSTKHVLAELRAYQDIVTPGQYIVVEDCWTRHKTPYEPWHAVEEFLKENPAFKRFNLEKQFIYAVTKDGWLRRQR